MSTPKSEEKTEEVESLLVTFDDDDPRKPINWPLRKKVMHTMLYGLTTFTAQYNSASMSSVVPHLMKAYNVNQTVAVLPTSLYVLGIAFGPMIFAPCSEIYGRKPTVLLPFAISGLLTLGTASSTTMAAILCTRFFAGLLASAPVISSGGVLADIFAPAERGTWMVFYSYFVVCGPTFAPVISAALVGDTNPDSWTWACWLTCIIYGLVLLCDIIFVHETYPPVLLKKRAKALRLETKQWGYHAAHEEWELTMQEFLKIHLIRPFAMLATPIVFFVAMFASYVFGIMYLNITSVAATFQNERGWSNTISQLPLLALCIGVLIGGLLNVVGNKRYARLVKQNGGKSLPEERFVIMIATGWLMPAGLFVFAWTSAPHIHWICPLIGLALVGIGFVSIFQGCLNYLVDAFTRFSASAIAANTFTRSVLAAVFPLFGHHLFDNLGVAWGGSTLAFIALGMIPIPIVFYFFGKKIRARKPYIKLVT